MKMEKKKCNGIRKTWPWKGYPCGNNEVYELDEKLYCKVHYAEAIKEKENKKIDSYKNNKFAPEDKIWVCLACGKFSKDKFGDKDLNTSHGWDESCIINCQLFNVNKLVYSENGERVIAIGEQNES